MSALSRSLHVCCTASQILWQIPLILMVALSEMTACLEKEGKYTFEHQMSQYSDVNQLHICISTITLVERSVTLDKDLQYRRYYQRSWPVYCTYK